MKNVDITGVEKCDSEGTILHLTVRGHVVQAYFAPESKQQVYTQIRKALIDTCISGFSAKQQVKI